MTPRRRIQNEQGMTLIEIIVVIVILGIMVAVGAQFLFKAAQVDTLHSERVEVVGSTHYAMEALVRELRIADPATVNIAGNTVTFDKQFGYAQDTTTSGVSYTYSPGADTLQRTGSATTTIATGMTAFSITDNGGWYTLSMTVTGAQSGAFSLTSAVRPRTLS
ncbi:prepilin-type N-terminal cleavage/methylation domain-containing protein [Nitrospina watsonii]|uniref:Prepilin-like protein n=1 Tax=Nitrospina watsonii TaxID=1323948 RepID=A0ABM9HGA4_9BACT|nr:prepilin-type N-terminal cleavage/methylation domain-containing protein [Nitrospina watsonii]CAI2719248.1 Putative Prepilin-like protein [Nitrospina watsonii]